MLLDRVRQRIRARHYREADREGVGSLDPTLHLFFHGKRHPAEMGAVEATAFLTALAVRDRVAASTPNQTLNALLFLYREVPELELPWLENIVRARRPEHLPVVLPRAEAQAVIGALDGVPRLMGLLMYAAGLVSWSGAGYGSRTSTSPRTRSRSATARQQGPHDDAAARRQGTAGATHRPFEEPAREGCHPRSGLGLSSAGNGGSQGDDRIGTWRGQRENCSTKR
jgi:hypothetical protein